MRPATAVVLGWTMMIMIFAGVLVGYGGDAFSWALYFSASVPLGIFASSIVLFGRRPATERPIRIPSGSASTGFLAVALLTIALSFTYGWWFAPMGLYPLGVAAYLFRKEIMPRSVLPHALPHRRPAERSGATAPVPDKKVQQ